MNATKFVVLLIFVGFVCGNVSARQLEEVSKLGTSVPKTVTTKGLGAELDVYGGTFAYNSENSDASAAAGPLGPSANGSGSVDKYTDGFIYAQGPNSRAYSSSSASGSTSAGAAAGPNDAEGTGDAFGYAGSYVDGATTPSP